MPSTELSKENRVRLGLAAVLCFLLVGLLSDPVSAQSALEVGQPAFVPRSVVVVRPFRVYADPTRPPEETGLRELSIADVERVPRRFTARDPRYHLVDFTAALLREARTERHEDTLEIAAQSARLARGHHQAYNLPSAVSELEASLDLYERTTRGWTRPEDVGDAWLTLARVRLELAQADAENAQVHLAHADAAFRQMIRVNPGRRIDPFEFPASVVEAYHAAYLEHLLDGGAQLRLDASEARRLARIAEADLVIYAFVLTDADGHRLVLQAYDVLDERFVLDEEVEIEPTQAAVSDEIEAALSRLAACQERIPPPVVDEPADRGTLFVSTAFSAGTYTERPTDRLFTNLGAKLSLTFMVRETFGVTFSGTQWTAPRDPDGELLRALETTRGTLGVVAGGRASRGLRVLALAGLDVTRIGRLRATDSFWCKVSEGEPFEFDDVRRCEESDLFDEDPQVQLGLTFGLGTDLNLSGPFWLHLQANTSIYSVPLEDRRVNFPLSLDIGLTYELGR